MTPQYGEIIAGSVKESTTTIEVLSETKEHVIREQFVVMISRKDYDGLIQCREELEKIKNKSE